MPKTIQESFAVEIDAGTKFDHDKGVVRGVKLNANRSKNKRFYSDDVLDAATPLYRGVSVYANHEEESGPWTPRRVESKMGRVRDPLFQPGGHRADLHVLPSWRWIMKDMEADPSAFGMSHSVQCDVADKPNEEGEEVITKIHAVESVDLVAEPATTRGMFEGKDRIRNPNSKEARVAEQTSTKDTEVADLARRAEIRRRKLEESEKTVESLKRERDEQKAKADGLAAAVEGLKKDLKEANDKVEKTVADLKVVKVESALQGLPEAVAKSLRESTKTMPIDGAIATIESVKAIAKTVQGTPPEPKSEGRAAPPAEGSGSSPTKESMLSAFGKPAATK